MVKILPRTLTITVPDVRLHLFEKPGSIDYIITENTVLEGDTVSLTQYSVGDYIAFSSDNPNYRVEQTGGKIIYLGYPSALGTLMIALALLLLFIVIMLLLIAYRHRHTITNAFAALRCRWKNRDIIINSPAIPRTSISENRFKPQTYPRQMAEREEGNVNNSRENQPLSPGEYISKATVEYANDESKIEYPGTSKAETQSEIPTNDFESIDQVDVTLEKAEIEPHDSMSVLGALSQIDLPEGFGIDVEHADDLITDSLAKNLVRKDGAVVYTDGSAKNIINVDTLSEHFRSGDRIDINVLKGKSLIPYDTSYVKVLARGVIDKPLHVYANDFSLSAVKMIALTGGEAIKTATLKIKDKNNQNT